MSNPGTQGSNQTAEPWSGVTDLMRDSANQAASLYGSPYQQYIGQRIAGPSDSTVAGQNLAYQRATLGAPDLNAARGMATDMAGGAWLGSNPYVQQNSDWTKQVMADNAGNMASAFATGTAANNDANAARAGAYGGSAHQLRQTADAAALAQQVGQMGNQYNLQRSGLGAQDWQSGIGNMLQAGGLAGQLSQDDWRAADYLRNQGKDQTAYSQSLLDNQYGDWVAQMNAPENALKNAVNIYSQLGGFGSSGSTSTYGGGGSPLGQIAGVGLLGAAGGKAAGWW